jgi:hypothetical protein
VGAKKIIFLIFLILLLIFNFSEKFSPGISTSQPDVWETHTIAANFAKYNLFPVMGIVDEGDFYQLDKLEENEIRAYIKCRFLSAGPVVDFFKPPVYGFILGVSYKIFGIDLKVAYYLNCVFYIGTMLLMMLIGGLLFNRNGYLIGGVVAIFYTLTTGHSFSNVLPETLLTLMLLAIVYYSILTTQKKSLKNVILLGLFISLGILTKGIMLLISFVIIFYFCLMYYMEKKFRVNLIVLFTVISITFLPWVLYANYVKSNSIDEMIKWKEQVEITEKDCQSAYILDKNWSNDGVGFTSEVNQDKLVTKLLKRYVSPNLFIIISNQAPSEGFLEVHNEYCIDGLWHPDWIFKKEAIYNNKYLDASPVLKVIQFYIDNPSFIYKIAVGKIKRATSGHSFSVFLLTTFLIGCYLILEIFNKFRLYKKMVILAIFLGSYVFSMYYSKNFHIVFVIISFISGMIFYRKEQMEKLPIAIPSCIIGLLSVLVLFYGPTRYVEFAHPILLLFSTYLVFLLRNSFKLKNYEAI